MKVGDKVWAEHTIEAIAKFEHATLLSLSNDWVARKDVVQFAGDPVDTVNLLAELDLMRSTDGHVSGDYTDGYLYALDVIREWITKGGG